jgi:hypothetical protein
MLREFLYLGLTHAYQDFPTPVDADPDIPIL